MAVIYETTVTNLGREADAFISVNVLIMFSSNAPEELSDYCILHEGNQLYGDIEPGQRFRIGAEEYLITAVGTAVRKNIAALGHISLKADGATEAEAPSTLNLEHKALPGVKVGDTIQIVS